ADGRAVRLWEGDTLRPVLGEWPDGAVRIPSRKDNAPSRGLASFTLLEADAFMVDSIVLPRGVRIELALPLKRFAREAGEIGRLLTLVVLLSSIAAFAVARFGTRRALAPLRHGAARPEA